MGFPGLRAARAAMLLAALWSTGSAAQDKEPLRPLAADIVLRDPASRIRDVASHLRGGRIDALQAAYKRSADDLIRGRGDQFVLELKAPDLPAAFVVVLGEPEPLPVSAALVVGVGLGRIEIEVSEAGVGGPFRPVASAAVRAEQGGYRIDFPVAAARAVKVIVHGAPQAPRAALGEIRVWQAAEEPAAGRKALHGLVNVAAVFHGGRVVSVSSQSAPERAGDRLIDGRYDAWESATRDPARGPEEAVFGFDRDRAARIAGLQFDRALFARGPPAAFPVWVEVWASDATPETGWRKIGAVRAVVPDEEGGIVRFAEPVAAKYLKLRFRATYDAASPRVALSEVSILEAPEAGGHRSLLRGREINLALPPLGGFLVRFSSQYDTDDWKASNVIDGGVVSKGWSSLGRTMPQYLVFGFRNFGEALVKRVVLDTRNKAGNPMSFVPKTVRIYASVSDSPVGGYRTVGIYTLKHELAPQRIEFPEPIRARFLQISVLETYGNAEAVLGEVEIIEGDSAGYTPLLLRRAPAAAPPPGTTEAPPAAGETPPHDLRETEPNNSAASAMPLPLGRTVLGKIDPAGDEDHYRLTIPPGGARIANLRFEGFPHLRAALEVTRGSADPVARVAPDVARKVAEFAWRLAPGDYNLRVNAPTDTWVALVVDVSGSMANSIGDLRAAVARFIADKPDDHRMMLVKFNNQVTLVQDFTADRASLTKGAEGLEIGGGTSIYDAMNFALKALRDKTGNRAIVFMTDGMDYNSGLAYPAIWDEIERAGIRVYAIGLGAELQAFNPRSGARAGEMLEAWTRATGGRFFFASESRDLLGLYSAIAAEFKAAPIYTIRADLAAGNGTLIVTQIGEPIRALSAPAQVALILDASGSMNEKLRDGSTKLVAAKRVLRAAIGEIPAGTVTGLRAYGHRHPAQPKARSCRDSELVVPFAPIDRAKMLAALDGIAAKGYTPIGYSLAQLPRDFGAWPGAKLVVLVTDGIETCDENLGAANHPLTVARRLIAEGIRLKINVVGFDIGDARHRSALKAIADATGGVYFDARDGAQLDRAIRGAMAAGYSVRDSRDVEIAKGTLGEPLELPEGSYAVVLDTDPPLRIAPVLIAPGARTDIRLNKEGTRIGTEVAPPR